MQLAEDPRIRTRRLTTGLLEVRRSQKKKVDEVVLEREPSSIEAEGGFFYV